MISAILRAQWLSMRLGGRRGAWLGIVTGVIWYGLWVFLSGLAFEFAHDAAAQDLADYLPLVFLGVCIYWQAMPILSASMGSSLEMRKLGIYPIPHGRLFQIEILLRTIAGAEMIMVVCAGTAGLALNTAAGWRVVPPAIVFLIFNVLLASGARSLLERQLSRRRVREALVFVLFMVWMVPRFLFLTGKHPDGDSLRGWGAAIQTAAFPWTAAAWAALGHSTAVALGSLAAWTVVAVWFGRTQFERSLRFDAIAAQSTPAGAARPAAQSLTDAFYKFPAALFRDPLAAIVEKELRSLARTPRYRMVFVMGFSFGLMVWLPMILGACVSAMVAAAVSIGMRSHWNLTSVASLTGVLFAVSYAWRIARSVQWKWIVAVLLAASSLVVGLLPASALDALIGDSLVTPSHMPTQAFAAVWLCMTAYGVLTLISGSISFWLYLRRTQPPAPEGE